MVARRLALEALEEAAVPDARPLAAAALSFVDHGEARAGGAEIRASGAGEAGGPEGAPLGVADLARVEPRDPATDEGPLRERRDRMRPGVLEGGTRGRIGHPRVQPGTLECGPSRERPDLDEHPAVGQPRQVQVVAGAREGSGVHVGAEATRAGGGTVDPDEKPAAAAEPVPRIVREEAVLVRDRRQVAGAEDRKSTRLNSS